MMLGGVAGELRLVRTATLGEPTAAEGAADTGAEQCAPCSVADAHGASGDRVVGVVRTLQSGAELSLDINVSATNADGESAVLVAAAAGDLETVRLLVEQGGDVELADLRGATPFFAACRAGCQDVAQYLFEQHGVDPQQADQDGCSPLWAACEESHLTLAWWLSVDLCVATDGLGDTHAPYWVDDEAAKAEAMAWRAKCIKAAGKDERARAEEEWARYLAEQQWRRGGDAARQHFVHAKALYNRQEWDGAIRSFDAGLSFIIYAPGGGGCSMRASYGALAVWVPVSEPVHAYARGLTLLGVIYHHDPGSARPSTPTSTSRTEATATTSAATATPPRVRRVLCALSLLFSPRPQRCTRELRACLKICVPWS